MLLVIFRTDVGDDHFIDKLGIFLGEEHRDLSAHRMSDQIERRQVLMFYIFADIFYHNIVIRLVRMETAAVIAHVERVHLITVCGILPGERFPIV